MLLLIAILIAFVAGMIEEITKRHRQRQAMTQQQNYMYYYARLEAEAIEAETREKRNILQEELHALYYKLDLLTELQEKQDDTDTSEKALKKRIATETSILTVRKRILNLENKIEKL